MHENISNGKNFKLNSLKKNSNFNGIMKKKNIIYEIFEIFSLWHIGSSSICIILKIN